MNLSASHHMQSVSQPTLLALDVGNTRLKWAYYEAACIKAQGVVFLENIDKLSEQDWHVLPPPRRVLGCSVAGDAIRRRVTEQLELWDTPVHWVVPVAQKAGVINGYDHPARLGADRWVALIGARQRLLSQGLRQPCVVVMVGTAVTVDAVDASGNFLGGFILPGHGIMLRALESGTAGLRVPTGQVRDFPTNTSDALTSGGTFAITGAIEHMVHHVAQYSRQPPACIVTGGAGWKVMPHITVPCELVERLVFDGLLRLASDE